MALLLVSLPHLVAAQLFAEQLIGTGEEISSSQSEAGEYEPRVIRLDKLQITVRGRAYLEYGEGTEFHTLMLTAGSAEIARMDSPDKLTLEDLEVPYYFRAEEANGILFETDSMRKQASQVRRLEVQTSDQGRFYLERPDKDK